MQILFALMNNEHEHLHFASIEVQLNDFYLRSSLISNELDLLCQCVSTHAICQLTCFVTYLCLLLLITNLNHGIIIKGERVHLTLRDCNGSQLLDNHTNTSR